MKLERLRVFFPPSSSLDLHPDHALNNTVKAYALGRSRPQGPPDRLGSMQAYPGDCSAVAVLKTSTQPAHI